MISNKEELFCPKCKSSNVQVSGDVFIEQGEYDPGSDRYAGEGETSRYECKDCETFFCIVWDCDEEGVLI